MAVLSQVGEIIVSSSQRNISSSSPRKTTSVTMQKVTERVGWWAISVMRRSKSSKHGKTMNLFFMFIFRDRYSIFKDSFHWNGRSCRKNAINWVKTPTFQLTFSNSADEKSCVIEINRTSSTFSVDKYLSGWGWSSAYIHRKLNRNEDLKGISLFIRLAYIVYQIFSHEHVKKNGFSYADDNITQFKLH